jgi:predicted dehydrogenase
MIVPSLSIAASKPQRVGMLQSAPMEPPLQKLRLIQCGVGGHGRGWVRTHVPASPDFELVAIVDTSREALAESGDAVGIDEKKRFTSLSQALDEVAADAVLTVTPPAVHIEHAKLTFARGLHLLTEKPIADTLDNAKAMVKLANSAGKQLVVAQNYRFKPSVFALRRLLADKALGDFGHGSLDFYIAGDFTGSFRQTMRYPLLVDMAIHHLDLIRAITGRNIARITAQSFNPSWSWYDHDCGLKMLMELEGPALSLSKGPPTPFSYSGDWSAKGRFTSWDGDWRLQCADGAIHWQDGKIVLSRSATWCKDLTLGHVDPPPAGGSEQQHILDTFAKAIRGIEPAPTSGEDNLYSFGAVWAALESIKQGKSVTVKDLVMNP